MKVHTPVSLDAIKSFWRGVFYVAVGVTAMGMCSAHPYTVVVVKPKLTNWKEELDYQESTLIFSDGSESVNVRADYVIV
jgi:hypothetical protein